MCSDCFDDDDLTAPLRITEQLIAHARRIEEDLPGASVTDEAWAIFFGSKGGSIIWSDYERMARCREAALLVLSMRHEVPSVEEPPPQI